MPHNKNGEMANPPSWRTQIGEHEGESDRRVELVMYRGVLAALLDSTEEDLRSAFPTIADTEIRPKLLRALEVIDELTSDKDVDAGASQILEEELGRLDLGMMRDMRAKFMEERQVKGEALFSDARTASADHVTVIPENWKDNPQ